MTIEIEPRYLSGATNGAPVLITATSSGAAQTIHTATSTAGEFDEVTLFAANTDATNAETLFISLDNTSNPIAVTLPARGTYGQDGEHIVLSGHKLGGGDVLACWGTNGSDVIVWGDVNRITYS